MSSFTNTTDAELGANPSVGGSSLRHYISPSDRPSIFLPLNMQNNENNEKPWAKIDHAHGDRRRRQWEKTPAWLRSWLSGHKDHQWDHYDLPTVSTNSLSETGSSPPSPIGGLAAYAATPKTRSTMSWMSSPLTLVVLFFLISTATVISALWTLPLHTAASSDQGYAFPKTVADVRTLALSLKTYYSGGPYERLHLLAVLSLTSMWAHAWSIPGSVLLNILTGVLLPPVFATLLQAVLTTLGSLAATILSAPLAPFITRVFPSINTLTRIALDAPSSPSGASPSSSTSAAQTEQASSPWARLALLRLIGIVPWSSINVFSGLARPRIPLVQVAVGAFVGVLPWTAVTCQIGDILASLTSTTTSSSAQLYSSTDDAVAMAQQTVSSILSSRETMLKLAALTLLSLAPVLAKDKLQALFNGAVNMHPTDLQTRHTQLESGELEARRNGKAS